jgi:hypothetical protein
MRQITLALVAISTLALTATAQADSYYGPRQVNGQCWKHQTGNSIGYWTSCPQQKQTPRTAQARGRR